MGLLLVPQVAGAQTTIAVDPGHGGADPGAVGCGFEEEDIVIDTSLRLRDLLQTAGFRVVMSRVDDTAVSLAARANLANSEGAARFMSIHANSAGVVATGIETFCSNNASSNAVDLRDRIQAEMISTWPLRDRGGKRANFSVLVNTNMPATLTELGFINNCAQDVRYLTDPNERQRAAQAHLDALVTHLGGTPPPPMTGTLTGVVFEDQGVGLDDTSVRLAGATVTVQETNDTLTSATDTGAWRFELDPGQYTVVVELAGHTTEMRTCDVVAGDVTWCSIGLFTGANPPDAGVVDSGATPDAGFRDGGIAARDGGEPRDGGATTEPKNAEPEDEGCGCTSTSRSSGSFAFALLLGAFLLRRRWLAVVMMVAATSTAQANPSWKVADEVTVATALHRPRLAPDGSRLIATSDKADTVVLVALDDRRPTVLLERRGAGYLPVWAVDGRSFGVRAAARPFSGEPLMSFDLAGRYLGPYTLGRRVAQADGVVTVDGTALDTGDKYAFAPIVDPTGRYVAFETLTAGLFLYRVADGRLTALGRGTSPAFSPDGEVLVFERTTDDGHAIKTSGLYVTATDDVRVDLLCDEAGRERFPSIAGTDGDYVVAFEREGAIVFGRVIRSAR